MGIRSNKQQGRIRVAPLSFDAGILVLSGSPVQTYDKMLKEYSADRTLTPLVIIPRVSAYDEKTNYGDMALTGVEWYEGAPKDKAVNRIVNGEHYTISDGSGSIPKYALSVQKNVPPESPMEFYAVAIFTDPRTGKEVRVDRSQKVYTHLYDNKNYSLRLNNDTSIVTDPLRIADRSGNWERTIEPQLMTGSEPVADEHAAYYWDILDGEQYRPITPEDPGIMCHDERGVYTRTLTYEAKFVTNASFRVRACEYAGERPQAPVDSQLTQIVGVKTVISATLECETIQTKGFVLEDDMNQPSAFELRIYDNRHEYGAEYDDLLQIVWKGQSSKPGEPEKVLATGGRAIEFTPAQHGFPAGYVFSVWAEVNTFAGMSLLQDKDGNRVVTDTRDAYVTVPIYN